MNNRILFSEGGQPVFLDDLKLIQDNGVSMNGALIRALTGQDGACLVEKYRYDDSGDVRTVYANAIVYDGEIIPFEGGEFSISEMMTDPDQDVYVCIGESTTDVRTFKDGTEHNCRIGRVAFLTLEEGAANVDCFPISTLDCLADLLRDRIELPRKDNWHYLGIDANASLYNGYIRWRKMGDFVRIEMSLSSETGVVPGSQRQWSLAGLTSNSLLGWLSGVDCVSFPVLNLNYDNFGTLKIYRHDVKLDLVNPVQEVADKFPIEVRFDWPLEPEDYANN